MPISRIGCVGLLMAAATPWIAGCVPDPTSAAPSQKPKPPEVFVDSPVEEVITETEQFTGRTMAVNTVEIRARVTGYLDAVNFQEGRDVAAGTLLAVVDPRSYQAEADRARAIASQSKARLDRLTSQLKRARQLIESKTISQEDFELVESDEREARATWEAAQADQKIAELNLSYTQIKAPLDGQISRRLVDAGNLVKADDTSLATIVTLDPIHVYFDVDERTMLRIRRLIQQGKMQSARDAETTIQIGLADEDGYPLAGIVNFVDNQVDAATGTLSVRARVDNADRLLSPGMFVRVQVPIGAPRKALLIREEALGTDQGQRFVYVVNGEDQIEYRRVKVGPARENLRVIESGLERQERVVVTGLQRVRPGAKVTTRPFGVPVETAAPAPAAAPGHHK